MKNIKNKFTTIKVDFEEYSPIYYNIGKDAIGNDQILEMAKNTDLWFHLKDRTSSHVIASIPKDIEEDFLEEIIKKGALLCKEHSKYKDYYNLEIIYTNVINVEKPKRANAGTVIANNTKIILC